MALAMSLVSEDGGAVDARSVSPSRKQRRSRISQSLLESTPWTATRCHRLLRPLLSHIAALHKEMAWPTSDASLHSATVEASREASSGPSPISISPRQAWASAASAAATRRGRNKHTYSARPSKQRTGQRTQRTPADDDEAPSSSSSQTFAGKACVWSDSAMPTPIVRKIRCHQLSSPVGPLRPPPKFAIDDGNAADRQLHGVRRTTGAAPARSVIEEDLAELRQKMPACVFTMYESILRATESLLRATTEPAAAAAETATAPVPVARKSLFAICLRQVPAYIAGRQEWEREEAELRGEKAAFNPSEVSFDIYSELEGLGPGDGAGYRHLRGVVRAHGVRILRDAVAQGVLADTGFCAALVRLCLLFDAGAEAEEILRAALAHTRQFPGPAGLDSTFSESPALTPVRLLIFAAQSSRRDAFVLREIAGLLSSGKLPQEWMWTPVFRKLWSTAVRAISSSGPCQGAVEFLTNSLNILCKNVSRRARMSSSKRDGENMEMWEKTLDSSLASLATLLTVGYESMAEPETRDSRQERVARISRRVRLILHSSLAASTGRGIRQSGGGAFLLLLTLYLTTSPDMENDSATTAIRERLELLWEESSGTRISQHHGRAVTLISSIAQCSGRGTSSPSSRYLKGLCGRVQALDVEGEPFKRLEADCAFLLAQRTNDLRDLAWAETLGLPRTRGDNAADEANGHSADELSVPNMFTGYKWDDGISEWVLKSPAPGKPPMQPPPPPPSSRAQSSSNRANSITTRRSRTDSPALSPAVSHPETPPRRKPHRTHTAEAGHSGSGGSGTGGSRRWGDHADVVSAAESPADDSSSCDDDELSFDASFTDRDNPGLKRRRAPTVVAGKPLRRAGGRHFTGTATLSLRSASSGGDRGAVAAVSRKRMRRGFDPGQMSDDELCM